MLAVRLPHELEERLASLASKTHRSKSYYVKRAIEEFLEDQEDYLEALAVLEKKGKTYTLDEVKKELGID